MVTQKLNSLFITEPGTFIGKTGRRVVVKDSTGNKAEFSLLKIKDIYLPTGKANIQVYLIDSFSDKRKLIFETRRRE